MNILKYIGLFCMISQEVDDTLAESPCGGFTPPTKLMLGNPFTVAEA